MKRKPQSPQDATLLDVLIDGFEKNEVLYGFHWRQLPLDDESAAAKKFDEFLREATRWKGEPKRASSKGSRQLAVWDDFELRRAGRGLFVLVRAPWFNEWWHRDETWRDDPMGPLHAWLEAEKG